MTGVPQVRHLEVFPAYIHRYEVQLQVGISIDSHIAVGSGGIEPDIPQSA